VNGVKVTCGVDRNCKFSGVKETRGILGNCKALIYN
jgi:hypothetical protein